MLLGAVLFIVNAGVSRVVLRHGTSSLELTTIRVTGTALVLAVVAGSVRRSALRPPRGRQAVLVVALGVVGVALLQYAYFVAIDRLTIGLALLLEYQAPVLVALWAKFVQGVRVSPRLWLGLALAVGGLALVTEVWQGLSLDTTGVLFGLVAAVAFASYFLIGEAGVEEMDSVRVMLWGFLVAAVVLNLVSPIWGADLSGATEDVSLLGSLADVRLPLGVLIAWVVVMGTLMPFGVELVALRFIPATLVTTIAMLEPIGAAALGWAWFGESMSAVAVLGCGVVVAGILLAQTSRPGHAEDPPVLT